MYVYVGRWVVWFGLVWVGEIRVERVEAAQLETI